MKRFSHIFMQLHPITERDTWAGDPEGFVWQPLLDIYEGADGITIVAELPGVEKDQVSVCVEGQALRISGVRHKYVPTDTQRVHQMEIPYGPFSRTVDIPIGSDIDRIEAEYEHGYLTIKIPRKGAR